MMELSIRVNVELIPCCGGKCDRGDVLFFPWFLRLTGRCHSLIIVCSRARQSARSTVAFFVEAPLLQPTQQNL